MLPPLPRCSGWAYSSLKDHPSVSAFPDSTFGSACTSTFSRFARRSLALRPAHSRSHQIRDRYPKASDISSPPCLLRLLPAGANRRVGLAPTGKAPPCHGARGNRSFAATHRDGEDAPIADPPPALGNGDVRPQEGHRTPAVKQSHCVKGYPMLALSLDSAVRSDGRRLISLRGGNRATVPRRRTMG